MALVLDETFATGIPGSFATARAQSGTLTATYDSGSQAVDLSNSTAGQSIWDITSQPLTVAGEMEIDLEFRADLSGASNLRHAGAWAVAGQAAVSNGFRFSHQNNTNDFWSLGAWTGGASWAGESSQQTVFRGASAPFNITGDRRVLNIRWDMGAGAGISRVSAECRIDGVLWAYTDAAFPSLRPGVFCYQSTVRLHSIKAWDAPQTPLTSFGGNGLESAVSRLVLAPPAASVPGPPAAYNRGLALGWRNTYQDGSGRIVGTVKLSGMPNTPLARKVRLIDESNGLLVRECWSTTAGDYEFQSIEPNRRYTVISYDHMHDKRAVIADNITPELMP
ncbi:MAG: hypothetical protein ABJA84_00050 [Polaromonas sp.]